MRRCCLYPCMIGAALAAATLSAFGQGSLADYERSDNLRKTTSNKVYRDSISANWLEGNGKFWYRIETGPETHEFVLVDAEKGERSPAFDHARLAEALTSAGVENVRPDRLPFDKIDFVDDAGAIEFRAGGKGRRCDLQTYVLADAAVREESLQPLFMGGPRTSRRTGEETEITFVNKTKDEVELFWLDTEGQRRSYGKIRPGAERQQHTFAGHVWLIVGGDGRPLATFEAEDEPSQAIIDGSRPGRGSRRPRGSGRGFRGPRRADSPDGHWRASIQDFNVVVQDLKSSETFALSDDGSEEDAFDNRFYWSPDSKKLVAVRTKPGEEHKVYIIESSPEDQVQPKLHSYDYRKPGDRIPQSKPQLFDLETRKKTDLSDELFANPWSIGDIRWAPDSGRFTFVYNQRGHQVLRIVGVDAATGDAKAIVDEVSKTFVDYNSKQYAHYLDETDEIVWMSERDGWNHLYLYDSKTGEVKNQITKGEWVVRGVDRVDDEKRQVWFRAGGIRPGQDPYYIHYCRVNLDGTGLTILTEGDGNHSVEFSSDRRFLIDTWSRVDQPPVTELRRADDGVLVCEMERAEWGDLLKTGWKPPERFVAKGRDDKTDIYGVIFFPTNFDFAKSYPVIESVYAGPHSAFVPKSFRSSYGEQSIAELGFIVVKIDGMGTSNRSKAFHDVAWKNLGDSGFPDRIRWIKAAANKHPCMDLTRVGIYGGSAGGQSSTRALLAHGDFYKVAVSDCGCHDNRMDKIWWNELWMGWPVGPHYEEQSNVTQAHNLKGKLLLIVGELDRNVDPASTMQVVNALIKADKDFDMLIIPGAGHGAAGTPYGRRRQKDYFVRNLLGVEPRWTP